MSCCLNLRQVLSVPPDDWNDGRDHSDGDSRSGTAVYYSNKAESSYRLKTSLERAAEAGLEAGQDPPGHGGEQKSLLS